MANDVIDETTHTRVSEMITAHKGEFSPTFDGTFDFQKDRGLWITGALATKKYSEIKRVSMKVASGSINSLKRSWSGHSSTAWEKVDDAITFLSNYSNKVDATRMFVEKIASY